MPSKTESQARFMAACNHGAGYASCPPANVSREFNEADKGGALLRHAMQHHAAGGMVRIKPPVLGAPPPVIGQPHQQSPLGHSPLGLAIQNRGNAGRYAGGMGLAPARPPRVPMTGLLRNIDQGLHQKRVQLKALGGSLQSAQPQQPMPDQQMDPHIKQVIMTALKHLEGMDASSAAAVLSSSPEAMSHPGVAAVAHALRTATGIAPATKTLNQLSQVGSGSGGQPLQTLRPQQLSQPQMPSGEPPQAGAQPPPSQ